MLTPEETEVILRRGQTDPAWWVREFLGESPWTKQIEILESIRDHERTAVASCHASGKSWLAARAALWFLFSFPRSIVATTAPTFRQVQKVIWQELRKAHRGARIPLGGHLLQTELHLDDGWYAFGFATDDPDRFQGLHAESLMVIVDEASGVNPDIYTAIEGVLTSAHPRLLAIGNPTEASGPFYQMFRSPGVSKMHISAFDTPNVQSGTVSVPGLVTRGWVEDKKKRWGTGSPMYQARVLGEFPESSIDSLIPLSWVEAAQRRELEPEGPRELGVDVARFGDDESVIALRDGARVRIHLSTAKEDTMQTTGRVVQALSETGASLAKVDAIGVGAGVVDRLAELGKPVLGLNASERPMDSERFANARAEWYWGLRERFEAGDIDLDPDEDLAAELTAIKYRPNSRGQIQIESKEDMKKRGLSSPDKADAVMLAFAHVAVDTQEDVEIDDSMHVRISPI